MATKKRTWQTERTAILALANKVCATLDTDNMVIVNGDTSRHHDYKVARSALKEFVRAIEAEEHLKENLPITLL